jgi:hypothetical protein
MDKGGVNMKEEKEKSAIETDDISNRSLYGTPTIGGVIVIGIIVIVIAYAAFFK